LISFSLRLVSVCRQRLQLHALAHNLGNFLRTLATPEPIKDWSLPANRILQDGIGYLLERRRATAERGAAAST
jgi:hypothetical protein